jgi:excisionase family DNA binding protein
MNRIERPMKSFCTTREAAELLGISQRTAQLWVESGVLEAWKTEGGHRRILRDSVERLLVQDDSAVQRNAQPIPMTSPLASDQPKRPFTLLVAEDEADLLLLYRINLEGWPMHPRVLTASDGIEALTLVGREQPDMLITDLHMPGLDGFHMLRKLHDLPELSDMAIVVVSGLDSADVQQRGGIPAGISLLPKPVPFAQLQQIAQAHFQALQARSDARLAGA